MEEKLQSHAEKLRGEGCFIQGSPEKQNQEDGCVCVCVCVYSLKIKTHMIYFLRNQCT